MSNSTKAGEEDSRWGLKLRGEVMDTRLTMWWRGRVQPSEGELSRLKERFSPGAAGGPLGASVSGGIVGWCPEKICVKLGTLGIRIQVGKMQIMEDM